MADTKISGLTDGGNLADSDELVVVRSGNNYRAAATDGWINDTAETWSYASGSGGGTATFTVVGDLRSKYTVGTRIKLTQTTVKYFVVIADPTYSGGNTTVTISAGSDYTLANAAISANHHSYMANPQGYPGWFLFAPSFVGWNSISSSLAAFSVEGRVCTMLLYASGTSNSASATFTAPIAAVNTVDVMVPVTDNGSNQSSPGYGEIGFGGTSGFFGKTILNGGGGFTASGTKAINSTWVYRI